MRVLLALLLAFALSSSSAHAYLNSAEPASGSTVSQLPAEITLMLSEPVEMRFSTFKVYHLPYPPEDRRELVMAIRDLMEAKLLLRNDEAERADTGVLTDARTSDTITLGLKDGLEPGTYVIMWRVLSIDTHTSEDFSLFIFAPED